MSEFPRQSAAARGLALCDVCEFVAPVRDGACPRCGHSLHLRAAGSLQRTWALTIAAFLLYFPANLLPVLRVESFQGDMRTMVV